MTSLCRLRDQTITIRYTTRWPLWRVALPDWGYIADCRLSQKQSVSVGEMSSTIVFLCVSDSITWDSFWFHSDCFLGSGILTGLSGHWRSYVARRHLRSSDVYTCVVQRTQSQIGDRSFSVAGPRLWNNLLTEIRRRGTTFGHYRRLLKAFLFV